ncbi:MAG: hypothetical protein IT434_17940, partial [Phycisphaerales bacterium]|nr:hypothetical protein [Phycisphaerales bacterium]
MMVIVMDKKLVTSLAFKNIGDKIYLIGESVNYINSSEYVYSYHKIKNTPAPYFNLDTEFDVQNSIKELIKKGIISSAHDCADGGLFITLLESAMHKNFGFEIATDTSIRKDAFLFGEAQSRVLVSVSENNNTTFLEEIKKHSVKATLLGKVNSEDIIIDNKNYGKTQEFKQTYTNTLGNYFNN